MGWLGGRLPPNRTVISPTNYPKPSEPATPSSQNAWPLRRNSEEFDWHLRTHCLFVMSTLLKPQTP